MAAPVFSNDTFYEVYGQNTGRVSRENFVEFRPHIPRKRKAYRNENAKAQAWAYAIELVQLADREGPEPGLAYVRIRYHEPGKETRQVWYAHVGDEHWTRMLATAKARA